MVVSCTAEDQDFTYEGQYRTHIFLQTSQINYTTPKHALCSYLFPTCDISEKATHKGYSAWGLTFCRLQKFIIAKCALRPQSGHHISPTP